MGSATTAGEKFERERRTSKLSVVFNAADSKISRRLRTATYLHSRLPKQGASFPISAMLTPPIIVSFCSQSDRAGSFTNKGMLQDLHILPCIRFTCIVVVSMLCRRPREGSSRECRPSRTNMLKRDSPPPSAWHCHWHSFTRVVH